MDWATRKSLTAITKIKHTATGTESAGQLGELQVLAVAEKLAKRRSFPIFFSIRVPKVQEKGKFELDLLLVGPQGLLALEVKSWGGALKAGKRGEWVQVSGNGSTLTHKDPAALLDKKIEAIQSYLKLNGVAVPRQRMTGALVWVFPIDIDPALRQQINSVSIDDLEPYMERVLFEGKPSALDMTPIESALERLPTWDQLYLRGGQVVRGDIVSAIVATEKEKISRADTDAMVFHYPGFLLSWLFFSPKVWWTDHAGKKRSAKIIPEQSFVVRLSGQAQELRYHLAEIHKVSFGWRDESYYRAVAPPNTTYAIGMHFDAKVVQIRDYGVFVRLDAHRDALFHKSDMGDKTIDDFTLEMKLAVKIVRVKTDESGKQLINVALA